MNENETESGITFGSILIQIFFAVVLFLSTPCRSVNFTGYRCLMVTSHQCSNESPSAPCVHDERTHCICEM